MKTINIAKDFSKHPAGRYVTDGPYSGEKFREGLLRDALASAESVKVILDGTAGYGSSFLEESFGGCVRKGYLRKEDLGVKLVIVADSSLYAPYKLLAERYINSAKFEGAKAAG